jgi:hypothetical protein
MKYNLSQIKAIENELKMIKLLIGYLPFNKRMLKSHLWFRNCMLNIRKEELKNGKRT